jgi:transcriptional regulator with XRE-family HTH domain
MALPSDEYPNRLREVRESKFLTRETLAARCAKLQAEDPTEYTSVGLSTIKHLERGASQPRASTAMTLAAVLGSSVSFLFPDGVDLKDRNVDRLRV